jgi:large subunit ribosomal protein L25
MSTTLTATPGRTSGSAEARRLRRSGDQIPAVIYGQGMSPVSVVVDRRDLRVALSGAAGVNTILEIKVGGDSYPAVVKEMQRHPVRRTVAHVDFLRINMSAELHVNVPVHLHGEAKAVLSEGGLVDAAVDTIEIITTPANMPNEILIDVTAMKPHDVIRLGDITLPAGCRAVGDPDMPVVTAITTRAAVEAAPAAAEPAAEAPKA